MRKKAVKLYILNYCAGKAELLSSLVICLSSYVLLFLGRSSCILNFRYHPMLLSPLFPRNKRNINVCMLMFLVREWSVEIEDQNVGFYRKLMPSCFIFSLRTGVTLRLFIKSKEGSFYLSLLCLLL